MEKLPGVPIRGYIMGTTVFYSSTVLFLKIPFLRLSLKKQTDKRS